MGFPSSFMYSLCSWKLNLPWHGSTLLSLEMQESGKKAGDTPMGSHKISHKLASICMDCHSPFPGNYISKAPRIIICSSEVVILALIFSAPGPIQERICRPRVQPAPLDALLQRRLAEGAPIGEEPSERKIHLQQHHPDNIGFLCLALQE